MTPEKKRRVATASGFVSGVIACLDAVRDTRTLWPPNAAWDTLRGPQRLEFSTGIALMVVTLVISSVRRTQTP